MNTTGGLSGGHRIRLYVDRVKLIFAFSIILHLACVVGFDLCMHNIMPDELLTRLTWHRDLSTQSSAQPSPAEPKHKDYEKGINTASGYTGMDSGGRLLRYVTAEAQTK